MRRVESLGLWVDGLGFRAGGRAQGLGLWVWGSESGLRFRDFGTCSYINTLAAVERIGTCRTVDIYKTVGIYKTAGLVFQVQKLKTFIAFPLRSAAKFGKSPEWSQQGYLAHKKQRSPRTLQ